MPLKIDPKRDRAWLKRVRQLAGDQPPPPAVPVVTPATVRRRFTRDGLAALIRRGWQREYDAEMRIQLRRGPLATGFWPTDAAACARARELEKASKP